MLDAKFVTHRRRTDGTQTELLQYYIGYFSMRENTAATITAGMSIYSILSHYNLSYPKILCPTLLYYVFPKYIIFHCSIFNLSQYITI